MADLEIVHISDLHWDERHRADRLIVVDALVADLTALRAQGQINPAALIFSGDLVNSGEETTHFQDAYDAMIAPCLRALDLAPDRLFIAPGNHDISRQAVRDARYVESGLAASLSSVDILNAFIDDLNVGKVANLPALERMQNYNAFIDATLPSPNSSYPLLKTYLRNIDGIAVGIACFNTAWRATGESNDVDRGHLLLGERNVDLAINDLASADIRIAVMHHPVEWLAEFDEVAVSSRLSANFDAIFCGHMHRALPQTRTTAQGTAILSQTGSAYAGRQWFNGYQIMKLSLADGECGFVIRSYYDTPRRVFDKAVNVSAEGTVTFPFSSQKKSGFDAIIETFLRQARPIIRQAASDHFNMLDDDRASQLDAKEAFEVPPLSKRLRNVEGDSDTADPNDDRYEDITVDQMLQCQDSFLIAGDRECGKTSLLHYISVLCAEGVVDKPRIPVILNVETLKANRYNLKRAISNYFASFPRGFDLDAAIDAGAFLFLADNFTATGRGAEALASQISEAPGNRWICISRPRAGSITGEVEGSGFASEFVKVRIQSLPRRSIRALSKRWSSTIGHSDGEVFEAVMKQLKTDGLPRTGYMVTLILWAMKQERELERVNEAMLLSNVADYLLGKADFTQSTRGKLDPRAKEITLEYLAEYLSSLGGYVDINDTTTFLSKLFQDKRLPFVAIDVLLELTKCGILDRSDDTISFKYKCFEEYFFALRMKSDSQVFTNTVKKGVYSDRAREIEMLAGLRRQNADIIEVILNDMKDRAPESINSVNRDQFDSILEASIGFDLSRSQLMEIRKKRLSSDQVDDLLDAAERRTAARNGDKDQHNGARAKIKIESDGKSQELVLIADTPDTMKLSEYMIASDLLARVIKNSDFTDYSIKGPATRVVIEAMVKICILFRKEMRDLLLEISEGKSPDDCLNDAEINYLVYYITRLLTKILSGQLSSQLSAPNISPMITEIIEARDTTRIERLLLSFLLQALRAHGWEEHWCQLLRDGGDSGFVIESVIGQMRSIVDTQYLDDKEHSKLHKVVDTAEEVLGWSSNVKGHVISDLKKAALQANLRDTA